MRILIRGPLTTDVLIQFLKFSVVGCSNVIISFIVFYLSYKIIQPANLLVSALQHLWSENIYLLRGMAAHSYEGAVANVLGYSCGMINSFIFNKIWTFKIFNGTWRQGRRFFVLNILCLILSTILILYFVDILGMRYDIVWFLTTAFITAINFVGNKYWTFINE